jgi:Prokaryotic membrane lipoprotein lipid attachment site
MKKIILPAVVIVVLTSCSGGPKNETATKIKEAITKYLTTGVDKKDVPVIDSIGISSIDTLTQKNSIKILIDNNYRLLKSYNGIYESKVNLLKADSALLATMGLQKAMYEKHGEKYDDASFQEQTAKMKADSAQVAESKMVMQKTVKTIDSATAIYATVDSVAFFEYFVSATVYFKGAAAEQGNFIISKDWKVRH